MQSSGMSFGNLGPGELGLICAAVLLMFGARSLTLSEHHTVRRVLQERQYFLPPLALGVATAVSLSVLRAPEPVAVWGILTVAAGAGLAALVAADRWRAAAKRNPWDLVTVSVFLLTWSVAGDLIASVWSPV
jgi:hypothetical protein